MTNLLLNVTQSFKIAPQNIVAQNLTLFDKAIEKEKYVAMQFLFNENPVWKVDLSIGTPIKPLSKISNLYIDAIKSQHDVIVYFPDTGYQVHIAAGTVFLVPSLVSRGAYVFFVSLVDQVTSSTDVVNIFALNVSIPFFDSLWQYPNGAPTSSPASGGINKSRWFFVGTHIPPVTPYNIVFFLEQGGTPFYNVLFMNSFSISAYVGYGTSDGGSGIFEYGLWYVENGEEDFSRPISTNIISLTTVLIPDIGYLARKFVYLNASNINWSNPNVENRGQIWVTLRLLSGTSGSGFFASPNLTILGSSYIAS